MRSTSKTPEETAARKAARAERRKRLALSFQSRTFRVGGYSILIGCIVLALAVFVNLMVGALPASVTQPDLTSEQLYTLSDQTKSIVGGLTQDVTVYWLAQSGSEDATLEPLLARYESLSGKLHVVKKDPVVYPTFASQYTDATVSQNSLIVVSGERSMYVDNTDIYVTDYSNYSTTGSATTNFAGETELTSAIRYVVSENLPVAYTLTGHGELAVPTELSNSIASDGYDLQDLNLLTADGIPEDAGCVIVYSPESDLSAEEADTLREYLAGGGKLLLVTDYLEDETPNLTSLMEYYGLRLVDGIVVEGDDQYYMRGYPYYLLPDVNASDVTEAIVNGGYYILTPVAQGIEQTGLERDTLSAVPLLTTSDAAYSKLAGYKMTTYDREDGDLDGPFNLAYSVTETVDSGETGIVWFTTSQMFESDVSQRVSGANYDLFLAALGTLCEQEESVSIHPKTLSSSYLTVPTSDASLWSAVLVGGVPVATLAIGAYIVIKRRRAQ